MAEKKQQCEEWQEAEECGIMSWEGDGWLLLASASAKKYRVRIQYCPFCGSPLDERGCSKNLYSVMQDSDDEIEVPF